MKKVVYTVIIGDYDDLKEPSRVDPSWEYVCITDNPSLKSDVWDIRLVSSEPDPKRQSRKYKILFHDLFPDYDLVVYCDATFQILYPLDSFSLSKKRGMWLNSHPQRNCPYEEARIIVDKGLDYPEIVLEQVSKYKEEGLRENSGLWRCGIMVRNPKNKLVKKTMDVWWDEVKNGSWRDQLSFSYACFKTGLKPFSIMRGITNNFFRQSLHKPKPVENSKMHQIPYGSAKDFDGTELNKLIALIPKNDWVHIAPKFRGKPITPQTAHLIVPKKGEIAFPRWLHDYFRLQHKFEENFTFDEQYIRLVKALNGIIIEH